MKERNFHKLLLAAVVAVVLLAAFGLVSKPSTPANADNVLSLRAPPFVDVAKAETAAISSFLDDEAGIAAYTQTPGSIDLSVVRDEFRTIERETDQYIIGSVGIPDYSEDHDPHVYVHTDGWVLAYYLAAEPASYVVDLRHYDGVEITSTKLENAMKEILDAIGVVPFTATYYDFRYPNATHIMLIVEAIYEEGDDSFDVELPSSFTYYETSWSHAHYDHNIHYTDSTLYVGDVSISQLAPPTSSWGFAHGNFAPAQLYPGASHTLRIHLYGSCCCEAFCGLALVYQEVP